MAINQKLIPKLNEPKNEIHVSELKSGDLAILTNSNYGPEIVMMTRDNYLQILGSSDGWSDATQTTLKCRRLTDKDTISFSEPE